MANTIPILTNIEDTIASYILSISRSSVYYFDWRCINVNDISKQTFPSAEIYIEDEDCQDLEDGVAAGAYNQHLNITIRVRVETDVEESNPAYDVNKELNKALDDLKRMFGNNYNVSDRCATIMYRGMSRVVDGANNILRAKYMDTRWLVKYTQDRKDPTNYSN